MCPYEKQAEKNVKIIDNASKTSFVIIYTKVVNIVMANDLEHETCDVN